MTLSISYDNNFLNEVCGKDHKVAKSRAKAIVLLAQTYFKMSATLGTTITLKIKEIKHIDNKLRLRQSSIPQSM